MGRGQKRHGDGGRGNGYKRQRHDEPWAPAVGSRGFLITCDDGKASAAQQEARNMLTEYYERLYPAAAEANGSNTADAGSASSIDAQIAQEVAQLTNKKQRVMHGVNTRNSSMLYIQLTEAAAAEASVVDLASAIVQDADKTKQLKSRLCIRVIPVEAVCSTSVDDIKATAERLVVPHFDNSDTATPVTFGVTFESRGAGKNIDRMQVINAVISHIKQPPHKVNLDNPEVTILVQMFKTACCLAVVKNFRDLCRFNLRELIRDEEDRSRDREAEKKRDKKATQSMPEAVQPPAEQNDTATAAVTLGNGDTAVEVPAGIDGADDIAAADAAAEANGKVQE